MGFENDLPPERREASERHNDFLGAISWVVGRFLPVALIFAIAALAYYGDPVAPLTNRKASAGLAGAR